MAEFSPLVTQLIDALRCLPGVGPKSAQRMAFHLLERGRDSGRLLAKTLQQAMDHVSRCQRCRNFSETAQCMLCQNSSRDDKLLCIVENPADVLAIEQTASYRGYYFVLMGHLSPLDGIGPNEIGIPQLLVLCQENLIEEVIVATNPTVEGQATAHYLAQTIKPHVRRISRIAHGVPMGGELEYIDGSTLTHALLARECMD